MNQRFQQPTRPKLTAKWLVIVVFALVAYGLGQPALNQKLGLNLPSLASLLGYSNPHPREAEVRPAEADAGSKKSSQRADSSPTPAIAELEQQLGVDSANQSHSEIEKEAQPTQPTPKSNGQPAGNSEETDPEEINSSANQAKSASRANTTTDNNLLYGLLRDTGREDYVSPAGLHYTRGSEEGHRLKHLERHLNDQPDRPGSHGVFDGDMPQVLRWIDEAYSRAKSKAKGTSQREEEGRVVYEVNFATPIGYIGGREGARKKNPDCKRLRIVIDGNRVITAFPF